MLLRRVNMGGYRFDRLRTLVIDDNVHMRKMLSAIVRAFGVTSVCEASNAAGGWEKLCSTNPDVVFLDWVMPGMTGIEFVKRARTTGECPNPFVPIVMITGHTQVEHVRQARDAGVTEFLAKPISAKSVFARMTAIIENPRSFVRTAEYFGPCRRRRSEQEYHGPERRASGPLAHAGARQRADYESRGTA